MEPDVAVMIDVPWVREAASPDDETDATPGVAEVQVAEFVISPDVPSLYCAEAANCWASPSATEGVAGDTAIETSAGRGGNVEPPLQPARPVRKGRMASDNSMEQLCGTDTSLRMFPLRTRKTNNKGG